jgi:hypothetical protein
MAEGAHLVDTLNFHTFVIEYKPSQVFFMGKMDKIWHIVNLFPAWRFILFPIFSQLLNARLISGDHAVTTHTFTGRWYTRNFTASRIGMAVHTIDFIIPGMDIVRKFDRLFDVFTVISPLRWNRVRDCGIGYRRTHQGQAENNEGYRLEPATDMIAPF